MVSQFVQRVVGFCIRYRVAVIIVTAAITGVMAWAVLDLEVDSDVTNLLPARLKVMELTEKYGRSKDSGELLVAVQADDLFSLEKLGALERAIRRIQSHPQVTGAIHPFNMIVFESEKGKLRMAPAGPGGWAPRTPAELERFRGRLTQNGWRATSCCRATAGSCAWCSRSSWPRSTAASWPRSTKPSTRSRPTTRCT